MRQRNPIKRITQHQHIMGEDVAEALDQLQNNLKNHSEPEQAEAPASVDDDEDRTNRVALATRAVPLIELLEAAKAAGANVLLSLMPQRELK